MWKDANNIAWEVIIIKIIKYKKENNGKYKLFLEDGSTIDTYEDVILKNNLLYKKDIDDSLYDIIMNDNVYEEAYSKSINYIRIRLRSINEMKVYLKSKKYSEEVINIIIERLIKNNLLNDAIFTQAFINDKLNFTTMGPYKIELELKKHNIDNNIISKCISTIDEDIIYEKINKLITKFIKSNKKYKGFLLKNKIYTNLINLGYSSSMILEVLNNYEF